MNMVTQYQAFLQRIVKQYPERSGSWLTGYVIGYQPTATGVWVKRQGGADRHYSMKVTA